MRIVLINSIFLASDKILKEKLSIEIELFFL